jgi:hypothetical protein
MLRRTVLSGGIARRAYPVENSAYARVIQMKAST